MKCERCGMENYDEAYYCRSCGAKMDKTDKVIGDNFLAGNPREFFGQDSNQQQYNVTSPYDTTDMNDVYSNTEKKQAEFYKTFGNVTSVVMIIGILLIISAVVFTFAYEEKENPILDGIGLTTEIEPPVIPTAPQIDTYIAKISYNKHTITDFSGEQFSVEFPIPEGYEYHNEDINSYASFSRDINNGGVSSLSAVIYSGDVQAELDDFSELQEENRISLKTEVEDTALGQMTIAELDYRASDSVVYHAYIKLDNENYFHITLSGLTKSYKTQAKKLIDLMVQESKVEYIDD